MRRVLAAALLISAFHVALAADPGEQWVTETSGSGSPPEQVQWLAPESLCRVSPDKLAQALRQLESQPFVALTAVTLPLYVAASCKGKYGQFPYLVRAVSTAGEGRLEAGLLKGELWLRYAGLGGSYPFEKTPVVLWLYAPPAKLHISASLVR